MKTNSPYEFDARGALLRTDLPFPRRSGKVRDVYDLGDHLMIVSSDRISAFDHILPSGIPDKGRLLTAMSGFWFDHLPIAAIGITHHLLSLDVPAAVASVVDPAPLVGRVMVTRKAVVVPFECVVRGYLEGSGWKEYQQSRSICGVDLPAGLLQCDRLPRPIFTPATKAEQGHDENVSLTVMADRLGIETADRLKDISLAIFAAASDHASQRNLIIADTKFEFGTAGGELMLIDEVLTPDSSRFWDKDLYQPGRPQASFDKQFVREYLSQCGWDKNSPPPPLPDDVITMTAAKYEQAHRRVTAT